MDISSKTRSLVEKGLVLDDHGTWVSLVDKLNKERFFIKHLEAGEVLLGKMWVPIKDALRATIEKNVETVVPEMKMVGDAGQPPKHEIDYSDKEKMINESNNTGTKNMAVRPVQFDSSRNGSPSKKIAIVSDDLFCNHHEHETIPFQTDEFSGFDDDEIIAVKKAMAKVKKTPPPIQEDVKGLLQSFEEFDAWESSAKKRQAVFWAAASGGAVFLGCAAFLLLLFS